MVIVKNLVLVPQTTNKKSWERSCRDLMRADMHEGAPWYVTNSRGSIKLEVKEQGVYQSRILEYEWSQKGFAKALPRIRHIYKNFYNPQLGKLSLAKSCEIVNTASSKTEINFDEIFKDFRKFCFRPSDETFKKSYIPVLNHTKRLLTSKKKPVDGEELMLRALEQWETGARMWNIQRASLINFLEWAILRGKISNVYAPVKLSAVKKEKRIGFALYEEQILQLIAAEKNPAWQFAYQLLAVYGLRPIELRHLVVKKGIKEKELWCMYRKSKGGTKGDKTEPRKLAPLYVKDGQGYIDWKLLERIENNEELPSLGKSASNGLRKHLERSKTWLKFKQEALKLGEEIVPYSFRHRYAKISHARSVELNLNTKDIALVMGHTKEVHDKNYARFIPDGTHDKFAKQLAA